MTTVTAIAAVQDRPPTVAEVLGIETDRALLIAAIPDVGVRRQTAARALADRRAELALMHTLLVEAYGRAKPVHVLEAEDPTALDLAVLAVA